MPRRTQQLNMAILRKLTSPNIDSANNKVSFGWTFLHPLHGCRPSSTAQDSWKTDFRCAAPHPKALAKANFLRRRGFVAFGLSLLRRPKPRVMKRRFQSHVRSSTADDACLLQYTGRLSADFCAQTPKFDRMDRAKSTDRCCRHRSSVFFEGTPKP